MLKEAHHVLRASGVRYVGVLQNAQRLASANGLRRRAGSSFPPTASLSLNGSGKNFQGAALQLVVETGTGPLCLHSRRWDGSRVGTNVFSGIFGLDSHNVRKFATGAAQAEVAPAEEKPKAARRRVLKDPIVLTDAAVNRIKTLMQGHPNAIGVRLGVRTRGCNGLSYTLNYAEKLEKFEDKVEKDGVMVIIEPKAMMHVIGTIMDYYEDELTAEFRFENPNAKGSCGCGESFNV